jgi:hypothetical protein
MVRIDEGGGCECPSGHGRIDPAKGDVLVAVRNLPRSDR